MSRGDLESMALTREGFVVRWRNGHLELCVAVRFVNPGRLEVLNQLRRRQRFVHMIFSLVLSDSGAVSSFERKS